LNDFDYPNRTRFVKIHLNISWIFNLKNIFLVIESPNSYTLGEWKVIPKSVFFINWLTFEANAFIRYHAWRICLSMRIYGRTERDVAFKSVKILYLHSINIIKPSIFKTRVLNLIFSKRLCLSAYDFTYLSISEWWG